MKILGKVCFIGGLSVCVMIGVLVSTPSYSVPIAADYTFSGTITVADIFDPGNEGEYPSIAPGDRFSGHIHYVYNPEAVDFAPDDPDFGSYGYFGDYLFSVNGFRVGNGGGSTFVYDNLAGSGDLLLIHDMSPAVSWCSVWSDDFVFYFSDLDGTVFCSDRLPNRLPIGEFDEIGIEFNLLSFADDFYAGAAVYNGNIDSIYRQAAPVPEPATLLLCAPGLLLLPGVFNRFRKGPG